MCAGVSPSGVGLTFVGDFGRTLRQLSLRTVSTLHLPALQAALERLHNLQVRWPPQAATLLYKGAAEQQRRKPVPIPVDSRSGRLRDPSAKSTEQQRRTPVPVLVG